MLQYSQGPFSTLSSLVAGALSTDDDVKEDSPTLGAKVAEDEYLLSYTLLRSISGFESHRAWTEIGEEREKDRERERERERLAKQVREKV